MVTKPPISPTDEAGSVPSPPEVQNDDKKSSRGFLRTAARDLSEEELGTAAARRFLIAEIERLDQECDETRQLRQDHNDLREQYARLDEKTKSTRWTELLSFVTLSVGSAGIGAAPSYISVEEAATMGWVMLAFSSLLFLTGVASRVFK